RQFTAHYLAPACGAETREASVTPTVSRIGPDRCTIWAQRPVSTEPKMIDSPGSAGEIFLQLRRQIVGGLIVQAGRSPDDLVILLGVIDGAADPIDLVRLVPILFDSNDDREFDAVFVGGGLDSLRVLGINHLRKDSEVLVVVLHGLEALEIGPKRFVVQFAKSHNFSSFGSILADLAVLLARGDILDFIRAEAVARF